ncbi:hypothetical protein Mapa_011731 [Marchantia paleacea]|nr:hypothetical protein Mapa_011731 [Marchantia paleacea]
MLSEPSFDVEILMMLIALTSVLPTFAHIESWQGISYSTPGQNLSASGTILYQFCSPPSFPSQILYS